MAFKQEKPYCKPLSIGVVIPAWNEEASIGLVVTGLSELLDNQGNQLVDEIVVADNRSKDKTAKIASAAGAKVVYQPTPGYGHTCMKAISVLDTMDIIVFMDGDHAFFAKDLPKLLVALKEGADLVLGSRTLGHAEAGSLTLHQQWGNRLAVFLIHYFWGHQYTDLGPFRVIRREIFDTLNMQELTYGWTVEMQIKVLQAGFQVCEVPVNTRMRIGQSKVSGTIKGSIGASIGILSSIAKLWWRQNASVDLLNEDKSCL